MSRELTTDEVRDSFMNHIRGLVKYWDKQEGKQIDKLEGLAFSILSMIDGCSMELPAFSIITETHPDNKGYAQENGENWYPDKCDITGGVHLHEMFYQKPIKK